MTDKRFIFDTLMERDNICNLKREKEEIQKGIRQKQKLVIYGKRNTGKTSLVKNVIIPEFKKAHPNNFVIYADFFQVKSLDDISLNLRNAFRDSFQKTFSVKKLIEGVKTFLTGLKPVITIDPVTNTPGLEIKSSNEKIDLSFETILEKIRTDLSPKFNVLLILDEFQDISFVDQAQGKLRKCLQEFIDIPVIIMGSKKHILANMFARPKAPFADFGIDIEFKDIDYTEYYDYIMERFSVNNITMDIENCVKMQDMMFRSPEPVNMLCSYLMDQYHNTKIGMKEIGSGIYGLIENRRSRYEELLGTLSIKQTEIMAAIAKYGPVLEPSGKDFLKHTDSSHATVLKIIKSLENNSFIEKTARGYSICNPLIYYFILKYRI